MKDIIQTQNFVTQTIVRLEAQMTNWTLIGMRKLSYRPSTTPDISNLIDLAQESCCFRNQDSISSYQFELDQN